MPKPGGPSGMGGMKPPGGGEVPEEFSQMMGGAAGSKKGASSSGSQQNSSAVKKQLAAQQMQGAQGAQKKQGERSVGTVSQEAKRAVKDIFAGLKDFFSINSWLGIDANNLDPEEKLHAQKVHQRFQKLDQEQQQVAQRMFEKRMQQKKMEEEEELRKKQMEEQKKAQTMQMPSSPQKGPVGPASGKSKKQNAMQQLKQDRTTMGRLQGE